MKKALLALGLSGMLVFSASAYAEGDMSVDHSKGGMQDHAGKIHDLLEQLSLTDEQKAQIKDLIASSRESMKELRGQMQASSEKLREAMQSSSVNLDLAKQLADSQGEFMSSLIVKQAELKNKIYDILTPEQRDQLTQLGNHVKGEMKKRFGSGDKSKLDVQNTSSDAPSLPSSPLGS